MCPLLARAQAYGALIYTLLGENAEQSFAHSWGVSYGVQAAREWEGIAEAALKAAVIICILERVHLTHPGEWLEDAVDYYSLQALLFKQASVGFARQIATFFRHTKRVDG